MVNQLILMCGLKGNSYSKNIKYAIINLHKLKLIQGERDFNTFAQATCQMEDANYFWKKLMKRDTKNSVLLDKIDIFLCQL